MRNRTYGGVRGRKTKVGRKLLRFPPTRFMGKFPYADKPSRFNVNFQVQTPIELFNVESIIY